MNFASELYLLLFKNYQSLFLLVCKIMQKLKSRFYNVDEKVEQGHRNNSFKFDKSPDHFL